MPQSYEKGQILRLKDRRTETGKPRPVLILSRRELNGGTSVIIAPFWTQKLEERSTRKQYVLFEAGEFGLPERCVLQLDSITKILIAEINIGLGEIGKVDHEKMYEIDRAIEYVLKMQENLQPR